MLNPIQDVLKQLMQQQVQTSGIETSNPVFQLATDVASLEAQVNAPAPKSATIYTDQEVRSAADKTLVNAQQLERQASTLMPDAQAAAKQVRKDAEAQRNAQKTLYQLEQDKIALAGKTSEDAVRRSAYALVEYENEVNSAESQARRQQMQRVYDAEVKRFNDAVEQRSKGGFVNWFMGSLKADAQRGTLASVQNNLQFENSLVTQSLQKLQSQLAASSTLAQNKYSPEALQNETAIALAQSTADFYQKGRELTRQEFESQATLLNVSKDVVQAGWTQMDTMLKSNNASASAFQAVYQGMLTQQMGMNLKEAYREQKNSEEMRSFHNGHYADWADSQKITDGRTYEQLMFEYEKTKVAPPHLNQYIAYSQSVIARDQSAVFRLYDNMTNNTEALSEADQKDWSVIKAMTEKLNTQIEQEFRKEAGVSETATLRPDQQEALAAKLKSVESGKDLVFLQQEYNKMKEQQNQNIEVAMGVGMFGTADVASLDLSHPMMRAVVDALPADTRQWVMDGGSKTIVTKLDPKDPVGTVLGNMQGLIGAVMMEQQGEAPSAVEIKRALRPALETMAAFYKENRHSQSIINPQLMDTKIVVPQSRLGRGVAGLQPLSISLENVGDLEVLAERIMLTEYQKKANTDRAMSMFSTGSISLSR